MPNTALRPTAAAAVMPIAHSTMAALDAGMLSRALNRLGKLYAEAEQGAERRMLLALRIATLRRLQEAPVAQPEPAPPPEPVIEPPAPEPPPKAKPKPKGVVTMMALDDVAKMLGAVEEAPPEPAPAPAPAAQPKLEIDFSAFDQEEAPAPVAAPKLAIDFSAFGESDPPPKPAAAFMADFSAFGEDPAPAEDSAPKLAVDFSAFGEDPAPAEDSAPKLAVDFSAFGEDPAPAEDSAPKLAVDFSAFNEGPAPAEPSAPSDFTGLDAAGLPEAAAFTVIPPGQDGVATGEILPPEPAKAVAPKRRRGPKTPPINLQAAEAQSDPPPAAAPPDPAAKPKATKPKLDFSAFAAFDDLSGRDDPTQP